MGNLKTRLLALESSAPKPDVDAEWKVVFGRVFDAVHGRPELQGDPARFEQISPYCRRITYEPRISADERRRAWLGRIIKGEGTTDDNRIFAEVASVWSDVPGWSMTLMEVMEVMALTTDELNDSIGAALGANHGKS